MDDTNDTEQALTEDLSTEDTAVQDAEIVQNDAEPIENDTTSEDVNEDGVSESVMSLLDIQDAINSRLQRLENLKEDMKPHKEMLDSLLANDAEYVEKSKLARDASKAKSQAKARVMRTPQAHELTQKVEEIKEESKELLEGLSYYLREYQQMTGANEFESADGELRQIVFSAKLVRKTNLNDR